MDTRAHSFDTSHAMIAMAHKQDTYTHGNRTPRVNTKKACKTGALVPRIRRLRGRLGRSHTTNQYVINPPPSSFLNPSRFRPPTHAIIPVV